MIKKSKFDFIHYIFWFIFILRSNAGGILTLLGGDSGKSGIDIRDYLFALLFACYLIIFHTYKISDTTYNLMVKYFIIFSLYYFIVFGYLVPELKENSAYPGFLTFLKKSRRPLYSLLLFVMIYRFYLKSHIIFFKMFILSSIIILSLFFVSFFTGIEILPITKVNRGFVDIDRNMLSSYGFMPFLIPMGVVLIVFKNKLKWKKLILIGFMMMLIAWLLSLTRRQMIAPFIFLFMAIILFNYFQRKELIPVKKVISILFLTIIFGFFISLVLPKYLEAGKASMEEVVNVVKYGETSSGRTDVRLGFGKDFMQELIINNYWIGTGYHSNWGGSAGDSMGYETSDYPFLSAIAKTGIFGLLIFLPIYIILIKSLIFDVKFLRREKVNYQSLECYFLVIFIIYFINDLLIYVSWFHPVSMLKFAKWYIMLAMYLASRKIFYDKFYSSKTVQITR